MFGILARLLELLYSFWPSYGGSIILFTVIIMLVLAPLTFKSTRSMLAMQALQPEMKRLQAQYKDDRQKLNEEMMKFYQENKISPLGGCLPMLLQMPVFFILYWVLLGLTKRGPFGADLGHSVACSISDAANTCTSIGTYAHAGYFDPSYLKESSDLYQSLTHTRVMSSFGLDLSQSAWNVISKGVVDALPYLVMVLIVMALTYLQQQQIQRRQPNKDQNPTQQMMMKIMPVAMGFIYIIIPSAVVIYFLVSSLFRIGQQAMVTRTFYTGPNAIAAGGATTQVGLSGEKTGGWKRFKESLPQVGGDAAEQRHESFKKGGGGGTSSKSGGGQGAKKKAPSKSSGGQGTKKKATSGSKGQGAKTKPSSGSKGQGAKKGSRPAGSGSKSRSSQGRPGSAGGGPKKAKSGGQGAKKKSAGASEKKAPRKSANGSDRPQRPSRSAPSRKAPEGPADRKQK